ncbi:MAG: hypothetical protein JSU00_27765 [Acidobacteria bacterium]|nr:hypothetical protein [Acidobacteriota bacterium]
MNRREFLAAAGASVAAGAPASAQSSKPRLPRKDCFFGIHLDLHPNASDPALGRDVSDAMVERFLAEIRPDYVQYDCKGHVGFLGYPSRVATSAPHIVNDSLAVWRRVTARHGVGLFIHFSGVWDSQAIIEHPDYAVVNADGKRDPNATSVFGPYLDQRMIPELLEASEKYELDGAWVDGDCWATRPDYGEASAQAFRAATGIPELPKKAGDPGWQEFLEFQREGFRRYVRRYCDALHSKRPKFQIASNWLYTTLVPERPQIPVDFLSGDYLGNASISTARLDARYLSAVGKPWDLMAWGFQNATQKTGMSHKPAIQLQQEAAVVLAQGGGFQIYYVPTRAGYIDERNIATAAKVAKFCRARQAVSHKSEPIPQVGVLFSTSSLYHTANKLFGGWGSYIDPARGMVDALVDSQYSVDVIPEWKLSEVGSSYPLIVVPDWLEIAAPVREQIAARAKAGGHLLIVGAANARHFAEAIGVRPLGEASRQGTFILGDEIFGQATGDWQNVELAGAKAVEQRYPTWDTTRDASIAATVNGHVAAIFGPAGAIHSYSHTAALRQFIRRVVARVFTPDVTVEGGPSVEVALRRKEGKTLLHLVNCAGMQVAAEYMSGDFVPPVGPLKISVRLPARPSKAVLAPEGAEIAGAWQSGRWTGVINRLEVHQIVQFS